MFHKSTVLFHHIIYVLAVSEKAALCERSIVLEGLESRWVCGVLVDRDDPEGMRMRGLEHLAEEALSRIGITGGA
jgi:hypothetical protein